MQQDAVGEPAKRREQQQRRMHKSENVRAADRQDRPQGWTGLDWDPAGIDQAMQASQPAGLRPRTRSWRWRSKMGWSEKTPGMRGWNLSRMHGRPGGIGERASSRPPQSPQNSPRTAQAGRPAVLSRKMHVRPGARTTPKTRRNVEADGRKEKKGAIGIVRPPSTGRADQSRRKTRQWRTTPRGSRGFGGIERT